MRNCEYDTNRFERLLSEIACDSLTNARPLYAEYAISDIGRLGTTNSLPFLYGCATNVVVGGEAMVAAVKISGLSSNVVDGLNQYLSLPDAKMADRAMSCYYLLETPGVTNAPIAEKTYLAECLTGFAPRTPFCVEDIDAGIIALDPTYRYSRRRLAVARAQSALDLNEYGTNYVNGVIGELVAYPESALGD